MMEEQAEASREAVGCKNSCNPQILIILFLIITRYSMPLICCYFSVLHGADALVYCTYETLK